MAEADDWAPVAADDWKPVGAPPADKDPMEPPHGLVNRLQTGLQKVLPVFNRDTQDVFMEGVHATMDAPGQIAGVTPGSFDGLGADIERKVLELGGSKEEAKREAERLTAKMRTGEGFMNLISGPVMAVTAPLLGAFRTTVSRPIEEAGGLPKETTEQLSMVALAALGMRAPARIGRLKIEPNGKVTSDLIGEMPKDVDFKEAAQQISRRNDVSLSGPTEEMQFPVPGKYEFTSGYRHEILEKGEPVGVVDVEPKDNGKTLEIVWIGDKHGAKRLSLGPSKIRALYNDLIEHYPEVETITGYRIGGAHTAQTADIKMAVSRSEAKLREMWEQDGIHPAEAVHDAKADSWLKNEIVNPDRDPALKLPAEAWSPENLIDAYHGSPHDFDAFSMDRIGTGEGAQAYGHGLYFAENEGVARAYVEALADAKVNGRPFDINNPLHKAASLVGEFGSREAAIAETKRRIAHDPGDFYGDVLHHLENGKPLPEITASGGGMYKVRITANKEHFLDWDKPLSEQSEYVKEALGKVLPPGLEKLRGEQLIKTDLPYHLGVKREGVSAALRDAGIPGIKYLDQGSRDTGAGTHNFVVFDDKLVEITHKNGEPVSPKERAAAIEQARSSVGAEVTHEPPPIEPTSSHPVPPPATLMTSAHAAVDKLFDMGRDLQMTLTPMATGSRESMALAKDFANSLRRNRWEWSRVDDDIAKRFTPEQRERMWNAADEESVARQLGESTEHQGLATLTIEERTAVEDLQTRGQLAWARARDLGMVEGEGLPAYTPRMVINIAAATSRDAALPLNSIGRNLRTKTAQLLRRRYMTAEETEAAAQEAVGEGATIARDIRALPLATATLEDAIAGRTLVNAIKEAGKRTGDETVSVGSKPGKEWFTIDHPALKTWRPKLEYKPNGEPALEGNMLKTVKDEEGHTVFEQVPIYIRGDFEGPLRAVLTKPSGPIYGGFMALKGKTMGLIMNSPMIHNAVEWGRALPAMPGKVATFKVYFEGNRAKNDIPTMREAIDSGLVPIGKRFFNQDITSIMEEPNLAPGRSLTAKVLGAVPGLFDEGAAAAVKRAVDKAGDFWHNTMLWDRVADLQMGLYTNFQSDLLAKGVDRQTASRMAAHWANRYAGALPEEAMSANARKIANVFLFSRSFTLGNLGAMKDMLTGLPKDVIAQIERDAGFRAGAISEAGELTGPEAAAASYSKTLARRKAMAIVGLDIALMYAGNSILQNAMNVMVGDSTLEKEFHGYAQRLKDKLQSIKEHPLELLQPFNFFHDLSATSENEPGKGDRIKIGYAADGTAIYARNPAGKIGEEFEGYLTGPLDMIRRKLGTIARPGWQIMSNDAGFGRKIYDPNADTPAKYIKNMALIAGHLMKSQFPEGQLSAGADLVKGEGDPKVNALQAFGPIAGVTFSKGAPGGPAVGEMYRAREIHQFPIDQALPDIRRQIQRGDLAGAQERMTELKIPPGLQRFYIRTSLNPSTRLSGRTLRDFYLYATPEQKARMENARQ
jgi:hypothetical protein